MCVHEHLILLMISYQQWNAYQTVNAWQKFCYKKPQIFKAINLLHWNRIVCRTRLKKILPKPKQTKTTVREMENVYTDFKLDNETNAWQRQKRIRQNCEKFVFNLYPTLSLLTQALQKCTKKIIKHSHVHLSVYIRFT